MFALVLGGIIGVTAGNESYGYTNIVDLGAVLLDC